LQVHILVGTPKDYKSLSKVTWS